MKQMLALVNMSTQEIRNSLYKNVLPEEYGVYIRMDYDKNIVYTKVITDKGVFKVNTRLTTPIVNFVKYVGQELDCFWG